MNTAVDPFVITAREQLKYKEQFSSLQPVGGFVTGSQAKGFFLQSQLPPLILGQIWALADTDSDGKMNIQEFSIACKLINLKLRGMDVPKDLPLSLMLSVNNIAGTTPTTMTPLGAGSLSPLEARAGGIAAAPVIVPAALPGAVPAVPGIAPATLPGVLPQMVQPMMGGGMPVLPRPIPMGSMMSAVPMLPPPTVAAVPVAPGMTPPTSGVVSPAEAKVVSAGTPTLSNPPSRSMSISERAPSIESPQAEWAVKGSAKRRYTQAFNASDRSRCGYLTGSQARGILLQSKLPHATLAQIWTLSDLDSKGRLSCDEFILAMFLCDKAISGEKIPVTLPPDWIPPSFRKANKSRQGSVSGPDSRTGSTTTSRHASVSSQGAVDADPTAGLPQTSFEDKRKENFDMGQAVLDRRRKLLQDQQRKEKEERERKERDEADKREKARLEAERKQQEEHERQLQRARELELEKEEQRKRELEAKEAARKELEKQRQQEWEQGRIADMNAQRQREQDNVLKQKAHNTQLNIELSTLNEKIKDLSQKICDTRAGVTNVKSVIDGMRSQRDTSMSDMAHLKSRIKEQNAKLLQLTQERGKWDAKSKAGGPTSDAAQQEQFNAAFANKQLIINQLKDKVENTCKEMENKKEDLNSNDQQMNEVKAELAALIAKCETLYADYDTQRTLVLELKYNKKNDTVTTASAWDTGASTAAWDAPAASIAAASQPYGLANDALSSAPAVDVSGPPPEGFVKYRAIYEFQARKPDEITFAPGDIILVPLEQNAEPDWLAGEINGHTGWFPEAFVERMEEEYAADSGTVAASETPAIASYAAENAYNDNSQIATAAPAASAASSTDAAYNGDMLEYYIAAYPYESAEAGDLSFSAGEMVMVIKKEGDWWTGTIGARTGMFPSNYVQKADVGSGSASAATAAAAATAAESDAASAAALAASDMQQDALMGMNGNVQTAYEKALAKEQAELAAAQEAAALTSAVTAAAQSVVAAVEESRTNEDLDTEVSQINTQSKSQTEPAESYSRPMSRTSSMTPGMRAKRSEIAQVIAPYEATSAEQLSLTRGQLIMIRKKTDTGWWEGELQAKGRRRQIGWFPTSYVKVLQGGRNSGRNTPVSGSRIEMTEQILDKVIALYPYKAQNDDELSFEKDDIISVLGRDEPEWWRGELNGLSGLFPSNYVGPFVTSGNV